MEEDLKNLAEAAKNTYDDADDNKTLEELSAEEDKIRKEAAETIADDEGFDEDAELSIRNIIGGDFLRNRIFSRQVGFALYIVFLSVLYTWNRYDYQDDTLLEDALRKELKDLKYNVLTQSSELMNYMRQSNVEEAIKHTQDSILKTSVTAPFLLREGNAPVKASKNEVQYEYDENEDGN